MRKMEEKEEAVPIIAKFKRESGHVYIYHGDDMLASYWHVSELTRDEDGKYVVTAKDGRSMGRIMGEAIIKESW
jgi:hypothetical protein